MALPTVTSIRLYPKGAIQVDAALRLTGDSWIACHVYADNPPILSFEDEHVSVSISPTDPKHVTADDVAQAQRLADALACGWLIRAGPPARACPSLAWSWASSPLSPAWSCLSPLACTSRARPSYSELGELPSNPALEPPAQDGPNTVENRPDGP